MDSTQKYYKNQNNEIFCIELQSDSNEWSKFIKDEWIEISKQEALEIANPTLSEEEQLDVWRNTVSEITPKQLRLVLLENGINAKAVETAIASIPDETTREIAEIEWNYATGYGRNNENLIMIATDLLGFDDLKIDAMWQSALLK